MAVPLTRDATRQPVPIGGQIAEVRRELALRAQVYPKRVREGTLRQSEANFFLNRMEAVLATLEFIQEHHGVILAAVATVKKAGPGKKFLTCFVTEDQAFAIGDLACEQSIPIGDAITQVIDRGLAASKGAAA